MTTNESALKILRAFLHLMERSGHTSMAGYTPDDIKAALTAAPAEGDKGCPLCFDLEQRIKNLTPPAENRALDLGPPDTRIITCPPEVFEKAAEKTYTFETEITPIYDPERKLNSGIAINKLSISVEKPAVDVVEIVASVLWRQDYPNGGSMFKTYESTHSHDKEIYRKEAREFLHTQGHLKTKGNEHE